MMTYNTRVGKKDSIQILFIILVFNIKFVINQIDAVSTLFAASIMYFNIFTFAFNIFLP